LRRECLLMTQVMKPIRAQLSSDSIASSCGISVHTGSPVLALCRRLLEEGCASSTPLQAFRGDTLCLTVRSIGEAAGLQVKTGGTGFERLSERRLAPSSDLPEMPAPRRPRSPMGASLTSSSSAAA